MNEAVHIGKLQRTYGLKGHIHLNITSEKEVLLDDLKFILLSVNNQQVPFFIESLEDKSGRLTVKLEKVDSETDAKKLVNKDVFVLPEFIGEADETELSQFIGYFITDLEFGDIGEITEIQEYPQHFVFVVSCKGKEVLLPATDELIVEINDDQRKITYQAPEGLIDIYLNT